MNNLTNLYGLIIILIIVIAYILFIIAKLGLENKKLIIENQNIHSRYLEELIKNMRVEEKTNKLIIEQNKQINMLKEDFDYEIGILQEYNNKITIEKLELENTIVDYVDRVRLLKLDNEVLKNIRTIEYEKKGKVIKFLSEQNTILHYKLNILKPECVVASEVIQKFNTPIVERAFDDFLKILEDAKIKQ